MIGNKRGVSLIELLIVVGLTAIVAFGSASVIYQSQKTAKFATIQNDIDRIHYLNLQIARNIPNIQGLYDLIPPIPPDSVALQCLQMNTTAQCTTFQKTITITPDRVPAGFPELISTKEVTSTISITPHCVGGLGCDFITVSVTTDANQGATKGSYTKRESSTNLPNFLFVPRGEIDYSCPSGTIFRGIDYSTQKAICGNVSMGYTPVASQLPLRNYDQNKATQVIAANKNTCASGYSDAGFSNGVCRPSIQLTPTTTISTTTTTVAGPPKKPTTTTTTLPDPGSCGVDDGKFLTEAPTPCKLCGEGTASPVTGNGPWKWTCKAGGKTDYCVAYKQDSWNCADGNVTTCGATNNNAELSDNNPGSATIQCVRNTKTKAYDERCRCRTGTLVKYGADNCKKGLRYYQCK
jgi:hypothetical protein